MNRQHDPLLHSNYLRQCLSQEKRPLAIFIGAGCPTAVKVTVDNKQIPLIPDIAGMTSHVSQVLAKSKHKQLFETVSAHVKTDTGIAPDVESILSHIRSLKQVAGKESVRGCSAQDLDNIDTEICQLIGEVANKKLPSRTTPYHKTAAWIGAIQRIFPVEIFTTNYDLLMEQAFEENRVPYFDGFVGSARTFFDLQAIEDDRLPARWARLWKIHGSLNWFEDQTGAIHRGHFEGERRVIYPSHLKYDESRRMPYLAMIDRMRAFLKQPTAVLIICGYSFNDKHLNEVIHQGLQGNSLATAFALLYGDIKNYPLAINLATSRSNLNLLADDEAVIGTKQSPWSQERDANICPRDTLAVKWVDHPHPSKTNLKNAHFELSDFATLGLFLEELIGEKERTLAS
jgi:hypothetical protein